MNSHRTQHHTNSHKKGNDQMKAIEIFELIQQGKSLKEIGEQIGVNKSTVQRRLNKAGYVYDKELQTWGLEEVASAVEEKSPIEERKEFEDNFVGYDEKDGQIVEVTKADIVDLTEEYNEKPDPVQPSFTAEEILALKELLKSQGEPKVNNTSQNVKTELNEKVKALETIERTRKTVVIEEGIGKQLDEFSAKEKIMKSDILHIALAEFFEKYSS
jgi:hypothetical protein